MARDRASAGWPGGVSVPQVMNGKEKDAAPVRVRGTRAVEWAGARMPGSVPGKEPAPTPAWKRLKLLPIPSRKRKARRRRVRTYPGRDGATQLRMTERKYAAQDECLSPSRGQDQENGATHQIDKHEGSRPVHPVDQCLNGHGEQNRRKQRGCRSQGDDQRVVGEPDRQERHRQPPETIDRKSTRLNSSHGS